MVADFIENLHQRLVALLHRRSEFVAVHVDVGEQAFHILLARRALGRVLDRVENIAQRFVQVGICRCPPAHIAEKLRREDIESPLLHGYLAPEFGLLVRARGIIEVGVSRTPFLRIDEGSDVLGNEAVEQHSQDVVFEVPAIDTAPQVVGYLPDRAVEFRALLFFCHMLFVYQFLNIHIQQFGNTNHRIQLRLRRVGTPLRYSRRVFAQLLRQPFARFILLSKNNFQSVYLFHLYLQNRLLTKILKIIQSLKSLIEVLSVVEISYIFIG